MWSYALWQPCRDRPRPPRRRGPRLTLEQLEDRTVPASFTAATVSDLIADINAANKAGGPNTITLAVGKTFTLTAVDNVDYSTDGSTGLPVIAAKDSLTIAGNGDTIERSNNTSTPGFRLFKVASGASLTLANLTLQRGSMETSAAIINYGSLTLNAVTLQNNTAQALGGGTAMGGALYSSGSLVMQNCTVQNNQALGASSTDTLVGATSGLGGGLYVSGGTASLTNVRLYSNKAQGGNGPNGGWVNSPWGPVLEPGGPGGNGLGGGMYVAGGTVSMHSSTVDHNSAVGGKGGSSPKGLPRGSDGLGEGGGLYLDGLASVSLDAVTLAQVTNNSASTSSRDIYGSYTICS